MNQRLFRRSARPLYEIGVGSFQFRTGTEYRASCKLAADFPLRLHFDLRDDANCHVTLHYNSRERDHPSEVKLKVLLAWIAPRYGGRRWYFICPATRKRVAALYLPEGCRDFLSRASWSLTYRTQREPKWKQKSFAAEQAHRTLGGNGKWRSHIPPRPPGMKLKTYARLVGRLKKSRREALILEEMEREKLLARRERLPYSD